VNQMTDVRLKFHKNALYDLRRAPGTVALLESIGDKILDGCNESLPENVGYRMSSSQGRRNPSGRWAVRVFTASDHAKRSNAVHNTLVRMFSSRGR